MSYFGGKFSHLDWLLPIINSVPHHTYVESYAGSAAVLLNKKSSAIEIYNDLYGDIVNFFKILRDNGTELINLLHLTPFSREEFVNALKKENISDLERARRFFVIARQVRAGLSTTATPSSWCVGMNRIRRGMPEGISKFLSAIEGLQEVVVRLKYVQIENKGALNTIITYDGENTLHYLDPPYPANTTGSKNPYLYMMNESNHKDLLDICKTLKGKVILSSYRNDLYDKTLTNWNLKEEGLKTAPTAKSDGKLGLRNEVIYVNF